MFQRLEEAAGSAMTYSAAAANAGVAAWIGQNWFLVLSAAAVIVRIAIDIDTWRRRRKLDASK
jgi:hypothetical protein